MLTPSLERLIANKNRRILLEFLVENYPNGLHDPKLANRIFLEVKQLPTRYITNHISMWLDDFSKAGLIKIDRDGRIKVGFDFTVPAEEIIEALKTTRN